MKQIIILPFLIPFFAFFLLPSSYCQQPNTALVIAPIREAPIEKLPNIDPILKNHVSLSLPIQRVPEHLYKKYMIRVKQTDKRELKQKVDMYTPSVFVAKSADHDGYDYYLSPAFKKKEVAKTYLDKLSGAIAKNAVLVKMEPKSAKCHCFGKF